jgi:glycosyl transferase family 25
MALHVKGTTRMKAFVISLRPVEDPRNQRLRSLLERNGIDVEVVPAVNGKAMPAGEYFAATRGYLRATGRLLTPSEIGCGLSHIEACRRIVAEELPYALVLEDDAILDDTSCAMIKDLASERLHERGFVHLGGQEGVEKDLEEAHGRRLPHRYEIWEVHQDDWRCLYRSVGYLVSGRVAKGLYDLSKECVFLSDDFTFMLGRSGAERIFLCNCVAHPLLLDGSAIEGERQVARASSRRGATGLIARLRHEIERSITYRIDQARRAKRARGYQRIKWKGREPTPPT